MNYVLVKNAIRHADKMHQLTKKRYYVIKVGGKIRVYDRIKIDELVDLHILKREMKSHYNLTRACIYHTK
jgi:hypothetical protein